jgi:predicted membrane protein
MMETVNHESGNNFGRHRTSGHWRRRDWDNDPGHNERRLWMGVGVILLGLVLLSNNMHFLSYELQRYVFTWEIIPIFIGLVFIIVRGKRSTGIILLFIGSAFYMKNVLNVIDFNFWQVFWPLMLILGGLMIIFRHYFDRNPQKKTTLESEHVIDEIALFGGGDRVITSQQFQGGKVTAVFGGLNYNMLKAKLAPGENSIDVFCLFGGMKLIIPEGWTVKIRVMSLFGGFNDKHRYKASEHASDQTSQLIIQGTVIFGGGEIKSYFD